LGEVGPDEGRPAGRVGVHQHREHRVHVLGEMAVVEGPEGLAEPLGIGVLRW